MAVDHEGSIYVAGNTIQDLVSGSGWLPRFILLKYASNGENLWSYRFDGPSIGVNYVTKILLDSAQNLVIFGQYGDTDALQGGLFALKISPEGQELWRVTYLDPVYGLGGTDVRWIGDRWVFWGRNNAGNGYRYFAWQLGTDGANLGSAISEFNAELFYTQHIDKQGNLLA